MSDTVKALCEGLDGMAAWPEFDDPRTVRTDRLARALLVAWEALLEMDGLRVYAGTMSTAPLRERIIDIVEGRDE